MAWDTDAASLAAFAIPTIVVPGVFAARNVVGSGRRQAQRWAAREHVVLAESVAEPVRRHLKRVRCARSLAALPLWWLATVRLVDADVSAAVATPFPALVAYVGAGFVAELTSAPLATDPRPRASLVPRTADDYLPTWLRGLAVGLVAFAALALTLSGTWTGEDATAPVPFAVLVTAAVAAIIGAEAAVRRIVARPQRTGDPHVLAADDALRATSVAMVYAVALLAALTAASTALVVAVPEDGGWSTAPATVVLLAFACMQVGVLIGLVRQETWGYRRRHKPPPALPPLPFTVRANRRRA